MSKAKILWMDLEMTGLDPEKDTILESAIIATDWDFKEQAVLENIVKNDEDFLKRRFKQQFWVEHPLVRDQLFEQNKLGKSLKTVEDEILKFLDENFEDTKILLAGNSIHQDRRFIRKYFKRLEKRLHYRMLDVSAFKVVFEGKYKKKFAKPEDHRALEDIRGSIMELKYYLSKVEQK